MVVETDGLHPNYRFVPITTEYLSVASVPRLAFGEILKHSLISRRVFDFAVEEVNHDVPSCFFPIPSFSSFPVDRTAGDEASYSRLESVVIAYCLGYLEVMAGPLRHRSTGVLRCYPEW